MKRFLMIIPIVLLYSCGPAYTVIAENENLLMSDTLRVSYRGENFNLPLKEMDAYYTYEYNVPNIGADTLYSVSRLVMPDIFNSAESVIQIEDATLKTIVGKGTAVQTYKTGEDYNIYAPVYSHNMNYTLRIQCYDGKIKISVYYIHSRNFQSFRYTSGYSSYYLNEAVKKGLNKKREVLDNTYGALIFAIDDTGRGIINLFVNTAEKYLKENFNI